MPIAFTDNAAILTESVIIEEAETLLAWLKEHPEGTVNLNKCTHLHTAVFQVLMALRPPLTGPPVDPFLKTNIWPLLQQSAVQA